MAFLAQLRPPRFEAVIELIQSVGGRADTSFDPCIGGSALFLFNQTGNLALLAVDDGRQADFNVPLDDRYLSLTLCPRLIKHWLQSLLQQRALHLLAGWQVGF